MYLNIGGGLYVHIRIADGRGDRTFIVAAAADVLLRGVYGLGRRCAKIDVYFLGNLGLSFKLVMPSYQIFRFSGMD